MAQGIADQPDVDYFTAAGGGVWKTVNAGRTWVSVGDGLPVAPVGALAIAPSDPETIYIGTGHPEPRYDIAAGHGVFKSSDGGQTWKPVGLESTQTIGAIWVDSRDADHVVVAAQGHMFGPDFNRGIYQSSDGGKTWKQTLAIDDQTGAVDLAADPGNPRTLYAAAWQARLWPWLSYFTPIVGSGSGLYRSTDGGATWSPLRGAGWPDGPLGRIGIAVTRAHGQPRLYATIDGGDNAGAGGIWRSDDGAKHWMRVNDDQDTFGSWYASRITVAPDNPDVIYTVGQSIRRSMDGGHTFTEIRGSPGGDDYHYLWINPRHPDHWVTASDQGCVVSVAGGLTWSDWYNQPTGQFYHLAADNRVPYWIYSGQQDSGTVAISSRSDYGALGMRDWHPVGGDERDYMIPDPTDPQIVYGSGLGGKVSRWDERTGQVSNISPTPVTTYGKRPTTVRYRYTWITPLVSSLTRPKTLYLGAQVLFRSEDQGRHWTVVSPDLSGAPPPSDHVPDRCLGAVDIKDASNCGYGVIFSIAPSPRVNGELWVGTDNGRIQLTRDDGRHWENVTPTVLPDWAKVSTLDVSSLESGTAYAAISNYRQDDFSARVLRTHDYGRTWQVITRGLPPDRFVTSVRADPVKRGLLYAGTETGAYVSFDDGDHWQALSSGLPTAQVNDLLVHGDDLIAATQGRAIWVLDGLAPLREMSQQIVAEPAHLFTPSEVARFRADMNRDTPPPPETALGENPPSGAVIDYWLAAAANVELEIRDAQGRMVRRFANDEPPPKINASRYFAAAWLKPSAPIPATAGMHRVVWDLHYPRPSAIHFEYSIAAVFGRDTPLMPQGALALPGRYDVVLKTPGHELTVPLVLKPDPRSKSSPRDLKASFDTSMNIEVGLKLAYRVIGEMASVHNQASALREALQKNPAHQALLETMTAIAEKTDPGAKQGMRSRLLEASDRLAGVESDLEGSDSAPSPGQMEVISEEQAVIERTSGDWNGMNDFSALNGELEKAKLPTIRIPPPEQLDVGAVDSGTDLP